MGRWPHHVLCWEPPIPSLGESPVPSFGTALGPLVSSQDDCGPSPITCGVPCPILGCPLSPPGVVPTEGGPVSYLGGSYLAGEVSCPGRGEGCRLPGGGPAALGGGRVPVPYLGSRCGSLRALRGRGGGSGKAEPPGITAPSSLLLLLFHLPSSSPLPAPQPQAEEEGGLCP